MIKPVEEKDIKKKAVKWSQRDQIRKDLKEAEENNVTVFELVDDIYNYKYLANAVREILKYDSGRRWTKKINQFVKEHDYAIRDRYREEYKKTKDYHAYNMALMNDKDYCDDAMFGKLCGVHNYSWSALENLMYEVHSTKEEDRVHVYVKVDWDAPEKYYEKGLKKYKEIVESGMSVGQYLGKKEK